MEITKHEIERIIENRYLKNHWKSYWGIIGAVICLLVILFLIFRPETWRAGLVVYGPVFVAWVLAMGLWGGRQKEYKDAALKEFEVNPTLTYTPEPKEQTEIAKT